MLDTVILTVSFGILSSLMMLVFLSKVEKSGYVESGDFWIFARLFVTRKSSRALGLLIHGLGGIVFAFLYLMPWTALEMKSPLKILLAGLVTGILHGAAVAVSQILLLAQHRRGFQIGIAHMASHVVFGLTLGILCALAQSQFDFSGRFSELLASF